MRDEIDANNDTNPDRGEWHFELSISAQMH